MLAKSKAKKFWFQRITDISGTSGTGIVAEGIVFSNGWAAVHWLTALDSVAIYPSLEVCEQIHSHGGATKIIWALPDGTD